MYSKCRHSGLYFLLFVITLSCCFGNYFAAQKLKTNIDGLERENKRPIKLSGVDHKTQEDAAQEEGLSVQHIPVLKLVLDKSTKEKDNDSQKAKPLAQYTIENTKEQEHENKQENSKDQEPEDKPLKSEENPKEHEPDDKPLKSEEKKQENKSKLDVTEEHESSTVKQSDDNKVTLEDEPPTKCTTDREVTIGKYTPPENNDDGPNHDNSHGGDDDDGKTTKSKGDHVLNNSEEEIEKTVSKVYKGPRPAKAPDHYIDDI